MKIDFAKMGGLVPAIVQDSDSGAVLMLGYMNEAALERTMKEKKVTFWSRSKQRLWQKGEESGNYLKLVSMESDCDNDAILIQAVPAGPTCHTGAYSCFGPAAGGILRRLFDIIKKRKLEMPADSYTSSLFRGGPTAILEKVAEESDEVIKAAKSEGKQRLIEESADLIYHLFVLLVEEKIDLSDVENELCRRNSQ